MKNREKWKPEVMKNDAGFYRRPASVQDLV